MPKGTRFARRAVVALAVAGSITALTVTATQAAAQSAPNRYAQVNLVSDQAGVAKLMDPNLVNAWGLAAGPTTPIWAADNGTNVSTLYMGGQPGVPPAARPLVVSIPGGAPSGLAFNGTTDFALSQGGKSGPALFLFVSEAGNLVGWNLTGDPTQAVLVKHTPGAVYKGLALVNNKFGNFLLATDFHHGRVDVFNSRFHRVRNPLLFAGFGIPKGYAPFNVAVIGNRVFITYAKQDAARHDDVAGPGNGFVNVYTKTGIFLGPFARRGPLNSPWGMTIAPDGFGRFAGDLLVGNFGNGRIHVYNPMTRQFLATLRRSDGNPVTIDGLWGLLPGNGTAARTSDVWFSAGPDGESHGLLGVLRAAQ